MPSKLRIVTMSLVAAALLASAAPAAGADRSPRLRALMSSECPDADLRPAAGNLGRIRAAIVCLHNQIRARRSLPPLGENDRLERAAVRHSRHMVARRFFAHTSPGGQTMVDRILATGYVRPGQGWVLGENLAWGTGALGTPRATMEAWMRSPGHRSNVLRRSYRELAVGVVVGVPVSAAAGATYTVDFGTRR